MEKPNK